MAKVGGPGRRSSITELHNVQRPEEPSTPKRAHSDVNAQSIAGGALSLIRTTSDITRQTPPGTLAGRTEHWEQRESN